MEKIIFHLPQEKTVQLKDLLMQYQGIFALNNNQPGTTNAISHEIDTGSAQPISQALYRSNPDVRTWPLNIVPKGLEPIRSP